MTKNTTQLIRLATTATLSVFTFAITRSVDRKKAAERLKRQAKAERAAAHNDHMENLHILEEELKSRLETEHFWDIVTQD